MYLFAEEVSSPVVLAKEKEERRHVYHQSVLHPEWKVAAVDQSSYTQHQSRYKLSLCVYNHLICVEYILQKFKISSLPFVEW